MALTPENASDTLIEKLFEGDMKLAEATAKMFERVGALMPETMFSDKPTYVIDLQRKYAFEIRKCGLDRRPEFQCVDMITHDPDPESRWHLIGYGATEGEAKLDLLEKIAAEVAHS